MREIISMLVVLSAICGVSGLTLSFLKQTTAPTIRAQVLKYIQGPAITSVFSQADNKPLEEYKDFTLKDGKTVVTVFPYKQNNKLIGVALEAKGGGYGGDIGVIVGFNIEKDTLLGIGITEHKETPGIGSAVALPKFTNQFKGKGLDINLSSRGGKIDAISGATISSTGTVTAVQSAVNIYKELKANITSQWQ
ncbi:RnfABCDGE type electron transport complex subunit G [Desulfovibrio litoralis]|uniref:Ion-translocating oxidoreductase complex subunit G n=1 Tax=Desulfovibrio litoralis DSM 11393 TaxID=1121455 RepID=A0A1M7SED7_9BACT|nr:RnfABCDGE type electron transport complex subunit G [Desulfovibrio litoralis]SHN56851.1 electron transport complex protein RnfG [Desulfovibrio litoralis DSM 11393]